MDANLNSPMAMGILDDLAVKVLVANAAEADIQEAQSHLKAMGRVFGLVLNGTDTRIPDTALWKEHLKKFQSK